MTDRISAAAARRMALAAQGFATQRFATQGFATARFATQPSTATAPTAVSRRAISALLGRLRLLQIDSVSVFERSHYLPVLARLGPYDQALLDSLTLRPGAPFTEYWAHEAAFVPAADLGLFAFRMAEYRERHAAHRTEHAGLERELLAEIAARGPLAVSEIEHRENVRHGPWWGWSAVKRTLEVLFAEGVLVTAGRRGFERRYALPTQVFPGGMPDPVPEAEAIRELVRRSAVAQGLGTASDLADYYRLRGAPARAAIQELEDAGELIPVRVEGWQRAGRPLPAWRHATARVPRRIETTALLSPFDPVVWTRDRALRLFGFHYRISIYTPAAQRTHGYYVLPVLVDDALVGRLDLKRDRASGTLQVQAAWAEPHAPADLAERLVPVLRAASRWQGLDQIAVRGPGDLAPALQAALRTSPTST